MLSRTRAVSRLERISCRFSRWIRSALLPGSMEYSAVTQPELRSRSQGGTLSSMLAAQSTRVAPRLTSAEPAACR